MCALSLVSMQSRLNSQHGAVLCCAASVSVADALRPGQWHHRHAAAPGVHQARAQEPRQLRRACELSCACLCIAAVMFSRGSPGQMLRADFLLPDDAKFAHLLTDVLPAPGKAQAASARSQSRAVL